jgi:hypothetical protein
MPGFCRRRYVRSDRRRRLRLDGRRPVCFEEPPCPARKDDEQGCDAGGERNQRGPLFWRDGSCWRRGLRLGRDADLQRIDPDRIVDVLELSLAEVGGRQIKPSFDLPIGVLRKTDCAGICDPFEACGDIDAVTHQVAVRLFDDVAQMNADPKFDAALRRQAGVALDHAVLHLDGAAHGVDHAAELD